VDAVCYHGECVSVCTASDKSYIGCEYFAVDLDNANVPCSNGMCDASASQFAVVVSNPHPQNEVVYIVTTGPTTFNSDTCTASENVTMAGTLPPKGLAVLNLPRRDVNGTVKAALAYRIAANAPLTAYQFNPLENVGVFSNDATVLLPANTADTDYYIMTREQSFDELKGFGTVVGISDNTEVTFTTTAKTLAGIGIPQLMPGESLTTTLNRFDVLNIETNEIGADLTGSFVHASAPVIVFGGSEAANAPNTSRCDLATMTCTQDPSVSCACTDLDGPSCVPHAKCSQFITCCADHLEMQLFPVSTWGTEYIAVRSKRRGHELDLWRFLASEADTQVVLVPSLANVPPLAAGQWFELQTDSDFLIAANKPILVGQFLAAEQAPNPGKQEGDAGTGDPSFILAAPTRQLRDSYVFLAPDKYAYDFVSVAATATSNVRLDGEEMADLDPLARELEVVPIAETDWVAYRANVADGFHILSCTEPCSVMVHGYDQYVSYGYPGGLNLESDLNE